MLPYILGLFSAFCFGVSNVYWKTASVGNEFSRIVFYRGIITSVSFAIIWFYISFFNTNSSLSVNHQATLLQYAKTAVLCFACSLGLVFYLLSLNFSPVSISVPLSSINIFSILTAVLILGETFRLIYFPSFALAMCGILLIQNFSYNKNGIKWNKGATYALLASLVWGTSYALFKFAVAWVGAIPLAFILECCVTITACLWIVFTKSLLLKNVEGLSAKNIKHYLILASLVLGGTLCFNLALQKMPVLLLNVLGNFTLAVSVIIGLLFYKEKITIKQAVGISLIFISIILVQFFN